MAERQCKAESGPRKLSMELKGQMIHLSEIDGILFLDKPSMEKLDERIDKGLYISDLPIHDATCDIILEGEQTKIKDGQSLRMEDLKKNVIEAGNAVEEGKNVELQRMAFPSNIAERMWRGAHIFDNGELCYNTPE